MPTKVGILSGARTLWKKTLDPGEDAKSNISVDVLNSHEYKKADIYPESRVAPGTSVVAGWSGGTIPLGSSKGAGG